jgi:cytochrome c biogenesis protein CcdA
MIKAGKFLLSEMCSFLSTKKFKEFLDPRIDCNSLALKTQRIFLVFGIALLSLMAVAAAADSCTEDCAGKVCVMYFYSPSCHACQSIADFMSKFNETYSQNITLHKFDVNKPENFDKYSQLCSIQNLSIEQRGIPLIVTKDSFLMGTDKIRNNLETDVLNLISENNTGCVEENICHQDINVTQTNQTNSQTIVTLPLIAVAAAADSINPCAIGVLIFLIGFLLLSSGKNRNRTVKIAAIYILTVYVAYFLAGLGILAILSKLTFLHWITKAFGAGVAILGLINIKDAIQNKPSGTLAIPTKAKPLIEKWVYRASIPAAIILGIIVAAVELPCTGGMYLAILTLMANTVSRNTAIMYLLIYNFIFVLPLIIITFLFVRGFEAEKMQGYLDRHKRKSRMIMGLVLLAVGVLLFFL